MPTRTLGCVPTCTYEEEELKHQNEKNVEFHTNGSQDKTEDLFKYLSSFCELLTSPYPNMQMRLSIALGLKQTVQNSHYGNNHILHIWSEFELLSEKK